MPGSQKKKKGFTLVELLVVVVIIGLLAAIALPNFIGAQQKARSAAVRGNMRTVQIASEGYATDSAGAYDAGTNYQNYLPGGSNTLTGGTPGFIPVNPCTGKASTIGAAGLATGAAIAAQRTTVASTGAPVSAGNLGYSQADAGNSYAVIGADNAGNYINAPGGFCLVLSNR